MTSVRSVNIIFLSFSNMSLKFSVFLVGSGILLISTRIVAQDFCNPSPCGKNTDCVVEGGRPVCSCKPLHIGNPLSECKLECEKGSDCSSDKTCVNYRCKDPCRLQPGLGGCGDYANCRVQNNQAICSCPEQYGGDAYVKCIPECTSQEECPSHLACIDLHCGDPCIEKNPCGRNTNCKIERHTAVCTCRPGYVGHPLKGGCSRQ